MEIKTKLSIGDKAWTVSGCKVVEIDITAITLTSTSIQYTNRGDFTSYPEQDCFPTREALIKHLLHDGDENV